MLCESPCAGCVTETTVFACPVAGEVVSFANTSIVAEDVLAIIVAASLTAVMGLPTVTVTVAVDVGLPAPAVMFWAV